MDPIMTEAQINRRRDGISALKTNIRAAMVAGTMSEAELDKAFAQVGRLYLEIEELEVSREAKRVISQIDDYLDGHPQG